MVAAPRNSARLRSAIDTDAPTAALIYQFREVLAGRSTRVADLEQPVFAWVEPDAAATEAHYGPMSIDEAASDLMAARIALVTQLRDLGPGDWEATAQHEMFGHMDVAELLLRLLAHDEEHRAGMLQVDLGGTL